MIGEFHTKHTNLFASDYFAWSGIRAVLGTVGEMTHRAVVSNTWMAVCALDLPFNGCGGGGEGERNATFYDRVSFPWLSLIKCVYPM